MFKAFAMPTIGNEQRRKPTPTNGWSYAGISVLMFGATLLAALVFAVIADTVVLKPVQRLLRKVRL